MAAMFGIILPLFLLIGLGYVAVKASLVKPEAISSLGNMVLYFAIPATTFSALTHIDLRQALEPLFLLAYALASLAAFLVVFGWRRWRDADLGTSTIHGLGAAIPNSMFIGYPLLVLAFPEPPTIAFIMAVLVENLLTMPLALILLELGFGQQAAHGKAALWRMVLVRILKNPLIWGITAGAVASLLAIPIPKPLAQTLDMLARIAAPVALFFIGASFATNSFKGHVGGMANVVLGKLVLHPAFAALFVLLLPAFDPTLQQALVIIAAVPMMAIYPVIGERYGFRVFCANTLLVTTGLAFVSLALVLHWVRG